MKLVHKSLTAYISALCVLLLGSLSSVAARGEQDKQPEYLRFYNPQAGFKPAGTNLTEIFLQLAGSLEAHGSPEPYLRHMQKEHERISARFAAKMGKAPQSRMPAYLTPEYIDRMIANWNLLAPRLGLDVFAKETGGFVREGIRGTRDTGTIVVEIFNAHQKRVVEQMKKGDSGGTAFDELKAKLFTELEFNKEDVDMTGYEIPRRDAVSYAIIFRGTQEKLFQKIDGGVPPEKAEKIKSFITGTMLELGRLAHSELEIGILEWSLQ